MIKNLQGRELYEMWLKTSVGETHTNGKGFVNFFCFGEGIFSDCVERDRVINLDGKITWPAGDDLEEDEVDEVKIELKIHKIFFKFSSFFSTKKTNGNLIWIYLTNYLQRAILQIL